MSHVRVKVRLGHPDRPNQMVEVADALVDTGASFTTVPRGMANNLGLSSYRIRSATTAAGPIQVDESYALFDYDGHKAVTPIWVSDTYDGVLIGVFTLEALGLAVDPSSGKLIDTEMLLL